MISRYLTPKLQEALAFSPIVMLQGARQTGKSTLVQALCATGELGLDCEYRTLDDAILLSSAISDPASFLANPRGTLIIDEIQRAPELFLPLKVEVDKHRRPGKYLLTGSANALLLPKIADSLAGRMQILTLWALAEAEINTIPPTFIDQLFSPTFTTKFNLPELPRRDLLQRMVRGGYPDLVQRGNETQRRGWFNAYIGTILQRDIRDLAQIEGLTAMPQLLTLIASRSASNLNMSDLSRSTGIAYATLKRYLALFEATFLICKVPTWSTNLGARVTKTPKLYICDTGLMAALLNIDANRLYETPNLIGSFLETFVMMEFRKQATWANTQVTLYHYQDTQQNEVDLVLEGSAGDIVGIETKSSTTVGANDFKGLRALSQTAGERFVRGIVLYNGVHQAAFGPNLFAVPLSNLVGI